MSQYIGTDELDLQLDLSSNRKFVFIFPDSLGECVSTLSKRFSASESFSDALSGISHSHKDRHSELRHRKQPYIQQETLKTKVIQ